MHSTPSPASACSSSCSTSGGTTDKTIFFITHSVEEAIFLGSRVIVMSARPGRIVFDEQVDFSREVGKRLGAELRTLPEFIALRDKVSRKIYESADGH